ncbi:piggyBac transposable element-derived protein 4-like [Montipora capricornis]|uniref:piggyBac transposable element-derived protein 4-like n=1 Tax=Montipora capricornis TaxID=246305 RepID=UPI0035F1E2AE
MLSSLLGLRRPFLCSQVFCSIFPFHFWLHKDINKPSGPTTVLPAIASAGDFFNLVFQEDLIQLIVAETNQNAQKKHQQSGTVDKGWIPVNNGDIKAFLTIRFIQEINSLPLERHSWSKNPILGNIKVQNVMSRNRYLKINCYLHFNDSSTALPREDVNHNKLHHIRPLVDRLTEPLAAQYMPNRENAIDERLLKFKGRLGFKQYMPMKPIKRGIKVWMCANSITHFVSQYQVYTGRPRGGQQHGLRECIVTELSSDLEDGYFHIYFDNFFQVLD